MTQPVKNCQKTQNSQKTLENKQKSLLVSKKAPKHLERYTSGI